MGAHPKNLIKVTGLPKLLELGLIFIVLMIVRFGGEPGMLCIGEEDATALGHMVVFGYFFIVFVQTVGVLLGEELNMQNIIFSFVGSILWFAVGSVEIENTRLMSNNSTNNVLSNYCTGTQSSIKYHNQMAMGAFSIITGFVFLIDVCAMAYYAKKERY